MREMFPLVKHFCPMAKKDAGKYQGFGLMMVYRVFFCTHILHVAKSALIMAVCFPEAGRVWELSYHAKSSWTKAVKAIRYKLFRNSRAYVFQKTSSVPARDLGKDL